MKGYYRRGKLEIIRDLLRDIDQSKKCTLSLIYEFAHTSTTRVKNYIDFLLEKKVIKKTKVNSTNQTQYYYSITPLGREALSFFADIFEIFEGLEHI